MTAQPLAATAHLPAQVLSGICTTCGSTCVIPVADPVDSPRATPPATINQVPQTAPSTTSSPPAAPAPMPATPPRRAPKKERRVQDYSGEADVEGFLSQFQMVAEYNGWEEYDKLFSLAASLKGSARQVLPADGTLSTLTFDQLCSKLRAHFGTTQEVVHHLAVLGSMSRQPKEKIGALIDRMRPIARWAYPSVADPAARDVLLIPQFIDALTDDGQRHHVRCLRPQTLESAAAAAEMYELSKGIEDKRVDKPAEKPKKVRSVTVEDEDQSLAAQVQHLCTIVEGLASAATVGTARPTSPANKARVQPSSNLPRSPATARRSRPKPDKDNNPCFRCGELGHWRRECPLPRRPRQAENGPGRAPTGYGDDH